jgi:FdhD protein
VKRWTPRWTPNESGADDLLFSNRLAQRNCVNRRVKHIEMRRLNGAPATPESDFLAVEDPLEIRVEGRSVAVVMRTPGDDRELAAGFLLSEGLIRSRRDLLSLRHQPHCFLAPQNGPSHKKKGVSKRQLSTLAAPGVSQYSPQPSGVLEDGNVLNVRLKDPASLDLGKLTRHLFTSSSCGICSKVAIEAVHQQFSRIDDQFEVDPQVLLQLPARLASAQKTFRRTGGLHACALFDLSGKLRVIREDVGRHNALDKILGWGLLKGKLPLRRQILLLSGRISFELMQKALAGGIPIVAAISAPSSLAVEFAQQSGQTLVGFVRDQRMNIYAGGERLIPQA